MGSKKRQSDTSLKDRLFKEFYRFSFFKAVDLLEKLYPDKKPIGTTLVPGDEAVRFSSKTGLAFPASEISSLKHKREDKPVDMEVAFMGLIGPSGVLPHWYNEQVTERMMEKDHGLRAFYDMFHHRLISLFYLAWKKHHLSVNYLPDAKDRISSYFLSLTGLGTPELPDMIGLKDKSLISFYSGILSRGIPSACTVEAAAGYFTGTNARIDQFIERLLPLDPEDQTRIGEANGQIGIDAVCGSFVMESQTKFRVNLGPMGYKDFARLMPDGEMLRPAFSLIRYMVGIEYEFEIRLFLRREEVPNCILGAKTPAPPILGETTWIKNPEVIHDHDPYATFQETDL
jgi:type VI secretion system protein ImpH